MHEKRTDHPGLHGRLAPWHGVLRGKAEVPRFFSALAGTVEVTEFTPLSFAANDTDVMVVIRFSIKAKSGKSATTHLHHWWRFRGDKVCFYRGTEDTALTAELIS